MFVGSQFLDVVVLLAVTVVHISKWSVRRSSGLFAAVVNPRGVGKLLLRSRHHDTVVVVVVVFVAVAVVNVLSFTNFVAVSNVLDDVNFVDHGIDDVDNINVVAVVAVVDVATVDSVVDVVGGIKELKKLLLSEVSYLTTTKYF